jgi:hypothetical protein
MKKSNQILSLAAVVSIAGISTFSLSEYYGNKYAPIDYIQEKSQVAGAAGAAKYLLDINKNPQTNSIDINDVLLSRKSYQEAKSRKSASSLGLEWIEVGPNNVGGRTRAFLIDPTNPQKIFAGGVNGGMWVSYNGGGWWQQVSTNTEMDNLSISWMARSTNGDIYVATGEHFAQPGGTNGNSGAIGGGLFKSTDGGETFQILPSTVPTTQNSTNVDWALINSVTVHPLFPNKVYVGTTRGLRVSSDGGLTWEEDYIPAASGNGGLSGNVRDINFANDGTVVISFNNNVFVSNDGSKGSFENKTATGTGMLAGGQFDRLEIGISKSNSNYIYAGGGGGNGKLRAVFFTMDKGDNWTQIAVGGSGTFEPYGDFLGVGQSWFDNILEVNPYDPTEMWLGGVELWRFKLTQTSPSPAGDWTRIGLEFPNSPFNDFYVHSDKHNIQWHPTDPNVVYVATDGGVSRTTNKGATHRPMNKNYNVTQFYSVAFSGNDEVIGGTQDNGTIYIDKQGNSFYNGNAVNGGDGGHVAISQLQGDIFFSTIYYGNLVRHQGAIVENFYGNALAYLGVPPMNPANASFITPIELWESFDDALSNDTVYFVNKRQATVGPVGNGNQTNFSFTLQPTNSNAQIVQGSVIITSSSQTLTDDGNGNLTGNGTGTINYATKEVTVSFTNPVATSVPVIGEFNVRYAAGDVVVLNSKTVNYPIKHQLTGTLLPGDSVPVIDKIQSRFVFGLNGQIWMTREALNFGPATKWVKLANVAGTVQHFAFSKDGNTLFASTQSGNLYRIDNLSEVTFGMETTNRNNPPIAVVQSTLIRSFSRFITSIAVDPNNDNNVVVTLGGYGQSINIHKSTNAMSVSPTFTSIQGNLPLMPVYSSVITKGNSNRIIIGTEYGIWTSDNGGSSWTEENLGFPRIQVHMLRQQILENNFDNKIFNEGVIYAGTHGRGIFKTETFASPLSARKEEENRNKLNKEINLKIFPNPANTVANLEFKISEDLGSADVNIFDMQGRRVKTVNYNSLRKGLNTYQIGVEDLNAGTYIVRVNANKTNITQRLVIVK